MVLQGGLSIFFVSGGRQRTVDQSVPSAIRRGGDRLWGKVRLKIGGKHLTPEQLFHNTIQSPQDTGQWNHMIFAL